MDSLWAKDDVNALRHGGSTDKKNINRRSDVFVMERHFLTEHTHTHKFVILPLNIRTRHLKNYYSYLVNIGQLSRLVPPLSVVHGHNKSRMCSFVNATDHDVSISFGCYDIWKSRVRLKRTAFGLRIAVNISQSCASLSTIARFLFLLFGIFF